MADPVFSFSDCRQSVSPVGAGAFAGFDELTVTVSARRLTSMSAVFLVLPLCLVTAAVCASLFLDPASDLRLSAPAAAAGAAMAFSFVVGAASPPVGYATRAHLLVLQAYAFAAAALLHTCYVRAVAVALAELDAAQAARRRLVKDAVWVAELAGAGAGLPAGQELAKVIAPMPPPPALESMPSSVFLDMRGADEDHSGREGDPGHARGSAPEKAAAAAAAHRGRGAERYEELIDGPGGCGARGVLASAAAQRFCAEGWGAPPVPLFGGLGSVTAANAAAWRAHAATADEWARAGLLPLAAATIAVVLGVESLGFLSGPLVRGAAPRQP